MRSERILITGAAGKTGLSVLSHLAQRGAVARAFIHRAQDEASVLAAGAQEFALGDLTVGDSVASALERARVVYHICPNMRPDEIEIGRYVIDACLRAGVDRFVYHSVLHPQVEAMPHHWAKLRVEELLLESGIPFTILQPAAYMQNLLPFFTSMQDRGVLEVPYAAETRLGMVDLEEVAVVAADVLTEIDESHAGAIYELAGAQVLTQNQITNTVGNALGRDVRVVVIPRDEWAEQAKRAGLSDYAVEALVAMFRHYERHGFWGNPRVLTALLGREPSTFASFCERHGGNSDPRRDVHDRSS